eukprot:872751-Prorocentrum_minimum.AAC.1
MGVGVLGGVPDPLPSSPVRPLGGSRPPLGTPIRPFSERVWTLPPKNVMCDIAPSPPRGEGARNDRCLYLRFFAFYECTYEASMCSDDR